MTCPDRGNLGTSQISQCKALIYRELLSKHAVKGMHACRCLAMWHGLAGLQQRRDFGKAFTASSSALQAGIINEGNVEPGLQQLPAR